MSLEENIENAATKLNIDFDWMRALSPQEILYLVDQCPFVQIVCADPKVVGQSVEILTANNGWKIHFYGDAMSSSPGHLLFNTTYKRNTEAGDDGDQGGGGIGTIIKQSWDTAEQMVEIAKEHGWPSINIADGHPLMTRAIWIAAERMGIPLTGFTPSSHDWEVRTHLALSSNDLEVRLRNAIQPH